MSAETCCVLAQTVEVGGEAGFLDSTTGLGRGPALRQGTVCNPSVLRVPADGADIGEVGEELQSAVAMLRTDPAGGPAVELLTKVLRNIVSSPSEPKFRRVVLILHTTRGSCAGDDMLPRMLD